MTAWRYWLLEMPSRAWIDKDLPLIGAQVVRSPNAPAAISGSLPEGLTSLYDVNGQLRVREWGCAIIAQRGTEEPVFAIVDDVNLDGSTLQVAAGGFTMYPTEMPWLDAEFTGIKVDPLEMVRKIWGHLQSYPGGYMAVTVDSTVTPPSVWIGEQVDEVSFTTGTGELVEFEAGPFRLANWVTDDLGSVIAKLQEETPFDYRERSSWNGEQIVHRLELGYPSLGVRRTNLKFEIGYNVTVPPPQKGGEYASEIWMQGAGEGRKRLATSALLTAPTTRMRRVHVATDKEIRSKVAAMRAARPLIAALSGGYTMDTIEVIDHDLAPFGDYLEGDEIRVTGDAGWIQMDNWIRILEIQDNCDTGRRTLKVETV